MDKKKFILIIALFVVTIGALLTVLILKDKFNKGPEISEELRIARETFDIELNSEGTEYVIYDLKSKANVDGATIYIPDTIDNLPVTKIYDKSNLSFAHYNKVASIVIGKNINYIGNYDKITDTLYPYGYDIFASATKLSYIEVKLDNPTFKTIDGVLYNKDVTVLIKYPCAKVNTSGAYSSYTAPDTVEEVYQKAFYQNKMIAVVTFKESLSSIGVRAFSGCTELRQVYLSEGLTKISLYAFENCVSLATIMLPSTVKTIETNAFKGCLSLYEVIFNAIPTGLKRDVFTGCSLDNLYLKIDESLEVDFYHDLKNRGEDELAARIMRIKK